MYLLHAPRFLSLEGRWRGLAWLISGIEPGRRIKVRLLPIAWTKLCRDLAYRYGVAEAQADRLAGHSRPTLYR